MDPPPSPGPPIAAPRRNPIVRVLVLIPVTILGLALLAVGPVAIYYSFEMREKTAILTTRGEEANARIINSYRAGRRGHDIHADVIFTTAEGEVTSQHLLGCNSDLLEREFVDVVYDPQDPSFLRPTECAGSNRLAWVVLGLGIAFSLFDLFLIKERVTRLVRG